ncbi:MAG: hypothetical protein KAS23_08400 [Anaerohalosphaera sp.]|nr:hypothetical protein [Anaerohalosphaera sp.]
MKKHTMLLLLTCISLQMIVIAGCQESNSPKNDRQVRLIVNENIELKEQLQAKDREIQHQKDLLADCQKKNETIVSQSNDAATGFIVMLQESTKALQMENNALKQRIKELEAKTNKP